MIDAQSYGSKERILKIASTNTFRQRADFILEKFLLNVV